MLIDALRFFFRLRGPFEAFSYEITLAGGR